MQITQAEIDHLVILHAMRLLAWQRAAVMQTDAADRRASRAEQALHEACLDFEMHPDQLEFVLSSAVEAYSKAPA